MKKIILFALFLTVLCSFGQSKTADDDLVKRTEEWFKTNPNSMPHWMTPDELERINEIGKGFIETLPPIGPVRQTAEFERMQGVLIRYPFGIPVDFIKQITLVTDVVTIVATTTEKNTVINTYLSAGIDTSKCDFLIAPSDSYWTRDYGPWYVVNGDDEVGICDFVYNRPRPTDDDIPVQMAPFLNEPLYGMNLIHTGGNYMTDGMGISASTDLVYVESGQSSDQVDQKMLDYLGIDTYHVVADPNTTTTIDHIDCWSKFLDVDKILIRSVPVSNSDYDELEASAAYFASQKSSYGNYYQVYRVNSPNGEPYTNSLIVNDRVFVPIMNSVNDAPALSVYQAAMPGYTIVGVLNTAAPWLSTDALHCRTRGVVDKEMLNIYHVAKVLDQPATCDYEISARIVSYGGHTINPNETKLFYKVGTGVWNTLPMVLSKGYYTATIPQQTLGSTVSYYIHSEDNSGRVENHPFIGIADPHQFTIADLPDITISEPDTLRVSAASSSSVPSSFDIGNSGTAVLNFSDITNAYIGYAQSGGTFHSNDFQSGLVYTNSGTTNWATATGGAWNGNTTCAVLAPAATSTGVLTSAGFSTETAVTTLYIDFDQTYTARSTSNIKVEYYTGSAWVAVYTSTASVTGHQQIVLPVKSSSTQIRFTGVMVKSSGITSSWRIDNIEVTSDSVPYSWLFFNSATSGTVSAGGSSTINLTCNAADLAAGVYLSNITVASDDLDEPYIMLPVKFTVSDILSAPANLTITASTDSAILDWYPVASASLYRIYRSTDPYSGFTEIDTSLTDSYTDTDVLTGNKYFYYITADNVKIFK